MKTIYYVINKSDLSSCKSYRKPYDIAIFMLGRRIDNFILIKDDGTPRVIAIGLPEFNAIESALEEG